MGLRDVEVDVVVAGAGAAGLAAAIRAAEGGCSVALLEASEHFRSANNTSMSTSMIPAACSRWQREAGIDDSPELFAEDVRRKTKGSADPTITAALIGVAPDLVEWLADSCGVPLELVTDFVYPGFSRPRLHSVPDRSGRTLLSRLLAVADDRAAITIAVPMRLRDVEIGPSPGAGGGVRTVLVASGDGRVEEISTRAVVLACGGFGANRDLVALHVPEIAGALYHGGDRCLGDALVIGERIGADLGFLDAYQGHGSVAVPQAIIVTWAVLVHGGILVNTSGGRFADESQGYSEFGPITAAQPGGVAFEILDSRIDAACQVFADYRDLVASRALRWAADGAALASMIGVPPDALCEEIERTRALASSGGADRFGRQFVGAPLEPPYGCVRVTGALFHTQGGVLVDEHASVLRHGEPVCGLYAAGGAAAGISGHGPAGYLAGNGLLAALGLGFLAGSHVASVA